jgi:hypothetical protein
LLTPTPEPSCHFPLWDLVKILVNPVPVYIPFSIVVPSSCGRCTQLYFQVMSFKAMDPPDDDAALVAATIPVVLWVMPLLGSLAPVGYIYDPTPSPDGRLLAAASAFFTRHGNQVFLDPCLHLIVYPRAGGITATIINVGWLPDHVLSEGLILLEPPSSSSEVDALGTSFMAAYLLAPAPAVPQGLVSLSPIGGGLAGWSLSFLGSTHDGGSMGSVRSFYPASLSTPVSSHSTWSVGPSSCPPDSWGECRHPDP